MRSPMSQLHCAALMRLLSATAASYKDTHTVDHPALSVLCHLAWHPHRARERWEQSLELDCTAALFLSAAHVRPSDNTALIYDSCRHHQQTPSAVCVLYSRD